MGHHKPTAETWNKTSITIRCPGCKKVNRMLVGLKIAQEEQQKKVQQ